MKKEFSGFPESVTCMNRRGFLGLAAAIAAGAALDPDRLVWKPKLISIPKPPEILIGEAYKSGTEIFYRLVRDRYYTAELWIDGERVIARRDFAFLAGDHWRGLRL